MRKKMLAAVAALTAAGLVLTGCSGNAAAPSADGASGQAASAKSAADFGGMDALVKAAKAEGTLNVIALPDDWANYGEIKKQFQDEYGIKINSITPDASSKEEIAAADQNKGTDQAPDVFDLGLNIAVASKDHFAPYKVETWEHIPAGNKEESGLYYNDYTGVMSVGYNATKYGEITSIDQLSDPKFKGVVALNGKPTEAGAAFNGFVSANLASGGSLTDLKPGIEFFKKLKEAGTLNVQDVTAATIDSGTHGVVFDWTYNQLSTQKRIKDKGVDWKVFVPKGGEVAAYYNQAINKDAPHPAAARLWMEYLYSAKAQNLWLAGGARPVLYEWMKKEGKLDEAANKALPPVEGEPKQMDLDQAEAANKFLATEWAHVVG